MEILLIGNGFDLEHKLPTSYGDFLMFCEKTEEFYKYDPNTDIKVFENDVLNTWNTNESIKHSLLEAFKIRHNKSDIEGPSSDEEYNILDELYNCIKKNIWLNYFVNHTKYLGENWIDFESEISKVIRDLDVAVCQLINGNEISKFHIYKNSTLSSIVWAANLFPEDIYRNIKSIETFTNMLNTDLEKLIRALEIYIAGFVEKVPIDKKSIDIENLNPNHLLSFNYSNTYERVYGKEKNIKYDYIHGKADINKNVETCNLVLGIDEYLDDNRKNEDLSFLTFKKYYQRIYKSTGNSYLDWVDEIKGGYDNYIKAQKDTYAKIVQSFNDGSFNKYPYEIYNCMELSSETCPQHILYIFGHSLDITDRDVLRLFICNENVQTKIYYYRKNQDDKKALGKIIKNLIQIIGQDELIRRTGGKHKTIEFIPQTVH